MNNLILAQNIQSRFASHAAQDDFLQAGKLEETVGLCLSGGGYRAMIYHVGALIRLNELGFLPRGDWFTEAGIAHIEMAAALPLARR